MRDIIDDIQLPKELLEKRGVDLTGEDFYIIMSAVIKNMTKLTSPNEPIYIRGKKELAEYLKISVATLEEIERGESPLSIFQYREINRKLITGDFGKVQASSDVHTRRPKGYGAQHTRKEWTNVVIRRK